MHYVECLLLSYFFRLARFSVSARWNNIEVALKRKSRFRSKCLLLELFNWALSCVQFERDSAIEQATGSNDFEQQNPLSNSFVVTSVGYFNRTGSLEKYHSLLTSLYIFEFNCVHLLYFQFWTGSFWEMLKQVSVAIYNFKILRIPYFYIGGPIIKYYQFLLSQRAIDLPSHVIVSIRRGRIVELKLLKSISLSLFGCIS